MKSQEYGECMRSVELIELLDDIELHVLDLVLYSRSSVCLEPSSIRFYDA
jgi:hypothetical protein